ncbi:MAG: hypothetical protein HRT82_09875, partial [Henriciella sp.]|nr:hypothetical protein [Henriciella sp.]
MRMNIPYLTSVNGRLHYRRRVKEHLRSYFGVREVKKSLGLPSGQEVRALPLVDALNEKFEAREKAAELAHRGVVDPHEIAAEAWEWALGEKFVGYDKSGLG